MKTKDNSTWIIKLPHKAKVLVEVGDIVKEGDKLVVFKSHRVEAFDFSNSLSNLSDEKREQINNMFRDKFVKTGDVFCKVGIFKNKICFPLTGTCLGFDEFKNLRIEMVEDEEKEIFAPIESKVTKIEDGKMVLEFGAREYKGEGLNGLKAWGTGEIKIIDDSKFLSYELDGNILFTSNLEKAFLLKAQVVGVNAVVTNNDETKDVYINLTILKLEKNVWHEFMKENIGKKKKMMVNAKMDKLLIVLE